MLDAMRNASKNWLGKTVLFVLFGLLIFSFAVWGIGDIFRGFGQGTVATIGDAEIETQEFRNRYQTALSQLQQRARRAVTNDEARKLGLDRQVLGQLAAQALLDERAKALGLGMSDKALAQAVFDDKSFHGPTGQFDRQVFLSRIRDAGMNETSFAQRMRATYLRQELLNSLAGNVPVPNTLLEAMHRTMAETRSVEYFTLGAKAAGEIAKPGDEELKKYFEARKRIYRAPEYRKIVTLAITPKSIADPSKISDEDARKRYEQIKDRQYTTPEKRQVQQIIFKAGEEAQARTLLEKIRGGMSFADAAKERKLTTKEIDLGLLAQSEFVDPTVGKAAFETAEGKVSDVVKGRFGPVLVHVQKVQPKQVKSFEDVKKQLKQQMAEARAKEEVQKLHDKIEDERTSGKILAEAAKAAGQKVTIIEAADRSGKDKAGKPIQGIDRLSQLLTAVFASDIGVDNETLTTPDGGYVWFEVASIDPARERKLEEVRAQVEQAWREQQIRQKLREKAEAIVKQIKGGKKIEEAAKEAGVEVKLVKDVKRIGDSNKLADSVIKSIYAGPVGRVASAPGEGLQRVVFKVLDAAVPPLTEKDQLMERFEKQMTQVYANEISNQYVGKMQADRGGLKVNQTVLRSVVGGSDQ